MDFGGSDLISGELSAFGVNDLIREELLAMVGVTLSVGNYFPLVGVTVSEEIIGLWWEWPYTRELLALMVVTSSEGAIGLCVSLE